MALRLPTAFACRSDAAAFSAASRSTSGLLARRLQASLNTVFVFVSVSSRLLAFEFEVAVYTALSTLPAESTVDT